ncbi:MAG: hypothetical protein M3463_09915 [Verrucomicrobiota bacterium]|nr:hypothetical protein [Verrucomicrobiota bacterium]
MSYPIDTAMISAPGNAFVTAQPTVPNICIPPSGINSTDAMDIEEWACESDPGERFADYLRMLPWDSDSKNHKAHKSFLRQQT